MNKEAILAMKPGRELDFLVATKVFDWHGCQRTPLGDIYGCRKSDGPEEMNRPLPFYSTDIATAWELMNGRLSCQLVGSLPDDDPNNRGGLQYVCTYKGKSVFGKSAPEVICKAALLTVFD